MSDPHLHTRNSADGGSPKEPVPDTTTGKKARHHLIRPTWLRRTLKTLLCILVVILLIPVLIYIPPVQTLLKNVACSVVKSSTGMNVGIERFRLKFPLDISLQGVSVVEATGDTMVRAREVVADVKLLPLLKLDVKINRLKLIDGYYRMVSADSSMIMRIQAGLLDVDGKSSANIKASEINLNKALIRDGYVSLYMNVWKKKPTPTDTTSTPFLIRANDLRLENFRFAMSMLPTIDTLDFQTNTLDLRKGVVDLRQNDVSVSYLAAADGKMTYLTPTQQYIKTHPAPVDTVSTPGPPMTIRGDSISLDRFAAVYGTKGIRPQRGFDAAYISVSDVAVGLKSFYNRASEIRLPITRLMARERCGLAVTSGSGTISVDSVGLGIAGLKLTTVNSRINADASIPFALMELKPDAPMAVMADGALSPIDAAYFMPSLNTYLGKLPTRRPIALNVKAGGSLTSLNVAKLKVDVPHVLSLEAHGDIRNPLDMKKLQGNLAFDANVSGPATIDRFIPEKGFALPHLSLKGTASAEPGQTYSADFSLLSDAGDAIGNGRVSLTAENYHADIDLNRLDVGRFVPDLGIGTVSAHVLADGAGFNPSKPGAHTDAHVDLVSAVYKGYDYRDIRLDASLAAGQYEVHLDSPDPQLLLTFDGFGTIAEDDYTFDLRARIRHADLQALGLVETICSGNGDIYIKGSASPGRWLYDVDLQAENVDWNMPDGYIHLPQGLTANILSTPTSVNASVDCASTSLEFSSASGLKNVVDCFTATMPLVSKQIEAKRLEVEQLQASLPPFRFDLNASGRGLVRQLLTATGMQLDTLSATVSNDSLLRLNASMLGLNTGSLQFDTTSLHINQRGGLLDYRARIDNKPGTLDEFAHVQASGYVGGNRVSLFLNQQNLARQTGYRLGLTGAVSDSIVSVHFSPLKATIAYLPWTLNADNYIDLNINNLKAQANLMAQSAESSLMLRTEPAREPATGEELHIVANNIHIQDFLQLSVFAPPVKASVSTDLRLGERHQALLVNGTVDVKGFNYNNLNVGDFALDLKAGMGQTGNSGGYAALKVNGKPAMTLRGALMKDSVNGGFVPHGVKVNLTEFPVDIANAFLGADVARLDGALNGEMALSGTFTEPLLNGHIDTDSLGVYIPMIGTRLNLGTQNLGVADNVIDFNDFKIFAVNKNPLTISGTVNARKFNDIRFDVGMAGQNVQLVGNDKRSRSPIFGKLFVNLDASARGPMKHFDINANVNILGSTDINYQLQTDAQTLMQQQQTGDVVTFVVFSDTTQVAKADSVETQMAMRIMASLNISSGTQACVYLSNNGTDRVELNPSGSLRYFQNYMGDMRVTGQLNLGEGFARYSIPVMGEKKFTFRPGCYVMWNGDVLNPLLNINAYDDMKVNVVQTGGNSHLVNFLVGLSVTNTLSAPSVKFDLEAEDDLSIQNELQSMSADQRAQAAMNMLITGQYTGQNGKSAPSNFGNMANTALYGFLTSQLNQWTANHIRGVDLTFGVDQYDKTSNGQSSTTTSYSYQVSKSLFNNKFKIVVGGNYSTDASADENFAQNLLSDISFEYMLKQTNTLSMYLKLFRHNGYESIVEGEVTETGVGFVMRRRMSNLRQLFRFGRRKKTAGTPADSTAVPVDSSKAQDTPSPHFEKVIKK